MIHKKTNIESTCAISNGQTPCLPISYTLRMEKMKTLKCFTPGRPPSEGISYFKQILQDNLSLILSSCIILSPSIMPHILDSEGIISFIRSSLLSLAEKTNFVLSNSSFKLSEFNLSTTKVTLLSVVSPNIYLQYYRRRIELDQLSPYHSNSLSNN